MNRGMGPQIDVPVGVAGGGSLEVPGITGAMHQPGWNGLTIKEILEKVDLFNITVDDGVDTKGSDKVLVTKNGVKQKEGKTVVNVNDPEAAYLGPKLWDKPVSLPPLDDTEFSIMNIDDFLNENNISLDADPIMGSTQSRENTPDKMSTSPLRSKMEAMEMNDSNMDDEDDDDDVDDDEDDEDRSEDRHDSLSDEPSEHDRKSLKRPAPKNLLPKSGENGFLYAESKRARAEREKEEKKRKYQMSIEFAPEDLALATIPGADFDPRRRAFSTEELRPQPIIRKRRKQYVPNDSKDGKYWEKRLKNNIAARRSREARRLKENQIALRAAFLEKENATLKAQIDEVNVENGRLQNEKKTLQEKLRQYEQGPQHF